MNIFVGVAIDGWQLAAGIAAGVAVGNFAAWLAAALTSEAIAQLQRWRLHRRLKR